MRDTLIHIMNVYGIVAVAYFAVLNLTYIVFTGLAWRSIMRHLRERRFSGVHEALASPETHRDGQKVKQATADLEATQTELARLMEHWEEAHELN